MYYEKPCMQIVIFGGDEIPYTDLVDASGAGKDYPYTIENATDAI